MMYLASFLMTPASILPSIMSRWSRVWVLRWAKDVGAGGFELPLLLPPSSL